MRHHGRVTVREVLVVKLLLQSLLHRGVAGIQIRITPEASSWKHDGHVVARHINNGSIASREVPDGAKKYSTTGCIANEANIVCTSIDPSV